MATSPPPPIDGAFLSTTISSRLHSGHVLTISLLPSGTSLLSSPPHLGIPKPCLYAAFMHVHNTHTDPWTDSLIRLMACAEHHTAAAARRGLLGGVGVGVELLQRELALLQTLLTSPLHKHTKSAVLWELRRWVLTRLHVHCQQGGRPNPHDEIQVVMESERMHPRNYYAWNHARWVVGAFGRGMEPALVTVVTQFCHTEAVGWCSPWAFLGWLVLLARVQDGHIVEESMNLGNGLLWGHECLWGFVRTVLATPGGVDAGERRRLIQLLEMWVRESEGKAGEEEVFEERKRERELQKRALAWIRKFGESDNNK